jgi:branched-chain amino acid transport system substrate-binding protein
MHITRRHLLQGGAAAGLIGALPLSLAGRAFGAAASGDPIILGHQCELTGWDAATGYWRDKAASAMVDWLNANGGVAGRPIKLVTVDTKSDVDAGVEQLRQLILEHKADIVIGSELTSIALASNKLANDQKVLYLTMSTSASTTGKDHAVPYQFRMTTNSAAEAFGATQYFAGQVGKRWTVLYADYAWGQSERDWWSQGIKAAGGEVVSPVAVPLDAQDLFPYVGKIDHSVDGIYIPVLSALQTIQTIRSAGLKQQIVLAGLSFSLFDYRDLGDPGEGTWGIELAPVALADMPDTGMAAIYDAMGLNAEGVSKDNKVAGVSMIVGICQSLGFLKASVEGSGWKSKEDNAKLIAFGQSVGGFKKGPLFPIDDVDLRAQDHQAFMDLFIVRVEKGKLNKKAQIARDKTIYPAEVDLTKG